MAECLITESLVLFSSDSQGLILQSEGGGWVDVVRGVQRGGARLWKESASRRSSFSGTWGECGVGGRGGVDPHCHREGVADNLLWIRTILEDQALVLVLTLIPNLELFFQQEGTLF